MLLIAFCHNFLPILFGFKVAFFIYIYMYILLSPNCGISIHQPTAGLLFTICCSFMKNSYVNKKHNSLLFTLVRFSSLGVFGTKGYQKLNWEYFMCRKYFGLNLLNSLAKSNGYILITTLCHETDHILGKTQHFHLANNTHPFENYFDH